VHFGLDCMLTWMHECKHTSNGTSGLVNLDPIQRPAQLMHICQNYTSVSPYVCHFASCIKPIIMLHRNVAANLAHNPYGSHQIVHIFPVGIMCRGAVCRCVFNPLSHSFHLSSFHEHITHTFVQPLRWFLKVNWDVIFSFLAGL